MLEDKTLSQKRTLIYVLGFLFSLSQAIPTYINSSFLAQFISENFVGIIYTASSIMAIAVFIEIPWALRRFGNLKVSLGLLVLSLLGMFGMIAGSGVLSIIAAFIMNFVAVALIGLSIDIFLEHFSTDSKTGDIRGKFLTACNSAWLFAPIISSYLLGESAFANVYIVSSLLLIPVIILITTQLRDFKDPIYKRLPFWKSLGEIWSDRDIKGILMAQFLLQFFYAWMIIYTPIYLHETVGFEWSTIGIIFSIMLLPFVLLDGVLGKFGDRHGEKKMLTWGFIIMGVATGCIAFVTDHNAVLWTIILFLSRVGAATVEIMIETYFFKKVDASKAHLISFVRMMRPFAYVIGPIVASILFLVFDMKGLFIFLGLLMIYGVRYSLSIKDTPVITE